MQFSNGDYPTGRPRAFSTIGGKCLTAPAQVAPDAAAVHGSFSAHPTAGGQSGQLIRDLQNILWKVGYLL
jgi:hypothetical protein